MGETGSPPIAATPTPPYYAVIFSSIQTEDVAGYDEMADRMIELAAQMPGFLGVESARDGLGITVSYWSDLDSISAWKRHSEHCLAQGQGRARWYRHYFTRIARVERDYGFERPA